MRKTTPVRECMSRLPREAEQQDRLASVVEIMRAEHCHHVPVMNGAELFGILSREDLHEVLLAHGDAAERFTAGEVCTGDVLTVDPTTPVVEAAGRMLERGVSSALVTDGDILVGIFTSTDALKLVAGA